MGMNAYAVVILAVPINRGVLEEAFEAHVGADNLDDYDFNQYIEDEFDGAQLLSTRYDYYSMEDDWLYFREVLADWDAPVEITPDKFLVTKEDLKRFDEVAERFKIKLETPKWFLAAYYW